MELSIAQTTSERVDDLPVILHWLKEMRVAEILDQMLPCAHKNRVGLSYGQLAVLLLAYIVTQADHRLSHVESWVRLHHRTLTGISGWQIDDKDASDDRLADLLSALGGAENLAHIEEAMGRHLVRAYALPTDVARCDSSSFSVYHQPKAGDSTVPLLNYGYSKDHRPDLLQYRHALGTIDPCGIPLVSATLPGNETDDSIYYPFWVGLVAAIGHRDFLYIADAKASNYQTRAQIHQARGIYCFPLPMTGTVPERLKQWVLSPPSALETILLPQQTEEEPPVGVGFEVPLCTRWQDASNGQIYHWEERYLVIRSETFAQKHLKGLENRLEQTEVALKRLSEKQFSDCCDLKNKVAAILKRYRSQHYFKITIHTEQITRQAGRGRPSLKNPKAPITLEQFTVQFEQCPDAIADAKALCGWRIYVTNASQERLSLPQAVNYYREQWQVERGFHRFKRGSLPALPLYLQDEQRIVGLMFLLTVALRLLTLVEFVVRQALQTQEQPQLAGLYAGNPKRATSRPTTEQLLRAFNGVTLYFLKDGTAEISPLNPLQEKILALMRVPISVYRFKLAD
jgi:transposase